MSVLASTSLIRLPPSLSPPPLFLVLVSREFLSEVIEFGCETLSSAGQVGVESAPFPVFSRLSGNCPLTSDCTLQPCLSSSPSPSGEPHSGLARLMLRINRRISSRTFGRPPQGLSTLS